MHYLDILPSVIAAIILVVLLAGSIHVLRIYRRDRRAAKVLPEPDSIEQAPAAVFERGRGLIAADIVESWAGLPLHEQELTRHALWTAMLLEATSDGSIDQREMRFVADLFSRMSGKPMALRPVITAAEEVQRDKKAALAEIAKASGIDIALKEHVLAGAFLVSVSDRTLAESETSCLGDIADALGVSRRARAAIFKNITKRLGV